MADSVPLKWDSEMEHVKAAMGPQSTVCFFFTATARVLNQDVSGDIWTHLRAAAARTHLFVSYYTHFGHVMNTRRQIMNRSNPQSVHNRTQQFVSGHHPSDQTQGQTREYRSRLYFCTVLNKDPLLI